MTEKGGERKVGLWNYEWETGRLPNRKTSIALSTITIAFSFIANLCI